MTKQTSKRYIERKLSVSKLIKMIPDELLENIAKDTTVDYQVKHLNATLMFKLFLFSILKSERSSSRFMEFFYNSSEFKTFSGKGGHQTRHSSIADRMRTIDSMYFESVFENIAEILEKHFSKKTKKVAEILRFDSTMVAVGAGLIKQGMQVGKKAGKSKGKKQLKFSIGQKGMLPSSVQLFTGQSHLSEDIALREAIIKNAHSRESIVVFDRGLQKRGTFVEFDESAISFVTRANNYIKYEKQEVFKVIKGRETETLVFEEDILVYLFDHYNKKIDKSFRLIKARMKKTDEPIYFLTNITDLTAREISEVYQQRWDIEVFFRFIKQELNFSNLVAYNENGIRVMMYMILITAMLILIYKKVNNFNTSTGNLNWRKDKLSSRNFTETFTYDNLDRLTTCAIGTSNYATAYSQNGNISSKFDAGTYQYNHPQPHAVSGIEPVPTYSVDNQAIPVYTSFEQPSSITESNKSLTITYDYDKQRIRSVYSDPSPGNSWTRIYLGNYEEQIINGQPSRYIHYISGSDGLAAVYIKQSTGTETTCYVSKDYLGNILLLTKQDGAVAEEYSYDAWGRRRNPANWQSYSVLTPSIMYRGFTGHEHLDEFGLINMNGRLYDPIVARFLIPDNYVLGNSTQSFNRYTYALNNPLKYNDPDGENPIIGAAIGAGIAVGTYALGLYIADGNLNNWSWNQCGKAAMMGALGGAAGGSSGAAVSISTSANGIIAGAAAGAITGATIGMLQGIIMNGFMNAMAGNDFFYNWEFAALSGGISGGIVGGISGGYAGYYNALRKGANPWTGRLETKSYTLPYEKLPPPIGQNPGKCSGACLEWVEKLKGGSRTQDDFMAIEGADVEQIAEANGYITQSRSYSNPISLTSNLSKGNPTLVTYIDPESLSPNSYHTVAIYQINVTQRLRWFGNGLPRTNFTTYVMDPAYGGSFSVGLTSIYSNTSKFTTIILHP